MTRPDSFKIRLAAAIKTHGNALCVGIDPHHDNPSIAFLEDFSRAHIDAASGLVPAVKFQAAFYEALGSRGVAVLERAVRQAKDVGLLVILDAKRGDISSTMRAYGRMAFDVMGADALTITPYMGLDVVEPLRPWLEKGCGIYAVWVSSNASGALVQDLVAASLLNELERQMSAWDLSGALGLVLGATKLDVIERQGLLERVRDHALLMPGVGAQGAVVTPTLRSLLTGGASLLPISRGLSFPVAPRGDEYVALIRQRITQAASDLSIRSGTFGCV